MEKVHTHSSCEHEIEEKKNTFKDAFTIHKFKSSRLQSL